MHPIYQYFLVDTKETFSSTFADIMPDPTIWTDSDNKKKKERVASKKSKVTKDLREPSNSDLHNFIIYFHSKFTFKKF
jgi:hypothetical protein